jgi:hypothetical protein
VSAFVARVRDMLLAAAVALAAAACSAPAGIGDATGDAAAPPQSATPSPLRPPGSPDLSCRIADDCVVKNVGNCCGYFPACVNKDSPVDPDAVRAECERTGTSSICGWQDIQACDCVQGQCRAVTGPLQVER